MLVCVLVEDVNVDGNCEMHQWRAWVCLSDAILVHKLGHGDRGA